MNKTQLKRFKPLTSDDIKHIEDQLEQLGFYRRVCLAILTKTYDELQELKSDPSTLDLLLYSCDAWSIGLQEQTKVLKQAQNRFKLISKTHQE